MRRMDILFTTVGVILLVAVWPALLAYAWNDPMLRTPRRRLTPHSSRHSSRRGSRATTRPAFGTGPRRVAG